MASHHLLTVVEVAERLRCSRRSVDRLIRAGELVAVRHLNAWKVREEDLAAYIESLDSNQVAS